MTGETSPRQFRIDTLNIPGGVDDKLAAERTRLIESYRSGEATPDEVHFELLQLYWRTQKTTNGETNIYLMEVAYKFPVEAGMSHDAAEDIYQAAHESIMREQAAAEAA